MNPIEKKILRHIVKASDEYKLIEDGDKIMVCMSGGKDSFAMLHMLQMPRMPCVPHMPKSGAECIAFYRRQNPCKNHGGGG